jgi:hypothetical protein
MADKEKSLDSMELEHRYSPHQSNDCKAISAADTENTDVLQQSADTAAQYTELSTCDAAAVGYSNTRFTSHDEMYTRVIVDSYTHSPTCNSAEENYFIPLAEEQHSELDLNDGCLEVAEHVYCQVLDDSGDGGSDVTIRAIDSHQNALSVAKLGVLDCLPSDTSKLDVLFDEKDSEQITYDNSARIAAYDNNADIITYDNSDGMLQNNIYSRVSNRHEILLLHVACK